MSGTWKFDVKACTVALLSASAVLGFASLKPEVANGKEVDLPMKLKTQKATEEQKASGQKQLRMKRQNFIENKGQWAPQAKFFNSEPGLEVWIMDNGLKIDTYRPKGRLRIGQRVGVNFSGSSKPAFVGQGDAKMDREYYPKAFSSMIKARSFYSVLGKDLYPGIDVVYRLDGGKARFDLHVKPGANPEVAALKLQGASTSKVNAAGEMVIGTEIGDLNLGKLFAYQVVGGKKKPVTVAFSARAKDVYGFKLGPYDKTKELVIDPLIYGSLWGGDNGWDEVHAVTTDNAGGLYLVGNTRASDFPSNYGPYSLSINGTQDAFVAKLQGDVYDRDYAATFGGSGIDSADYVQVDRAGNLWIVGKSQSSDFSGVRRDSVWNIRLDQTATNGTISVSVQANVPQSVSTTVSVPYNFSAAQLQAALNSQTGFSSLTCSDENTSHPIVRLKMPYPNVITSVSVNSSSLFPKYISNVPGLSNYYRLQSGATAPTGGTFLLSGTYTNGVPFVLQFPYNTSASNIQSKLNQVDPAQTWVAVSSPAGGNGALPGIAQILKVPTGASLVGIDSTGLTASGATYVLNQGYTSLKFYADTTRTLPTGGSAVFTVTNGTSTATLSVSASPTLTPAAVQAQFIAALSAIGAIDVYVDVSGGSSVPSGTMSITIWSSSSTFASVSVSDASLLPHPSYPCYQGSYAFLMRWKVNGNILDPEVGAEKILTWGGDEADVTVNGFNIYKSADTPSAEDVPFYFAGTSYISGEGHQVSIQSANNGTPISTVIPNHGGQFSYRLRASFSNSTGQFAINSGGTDYIDDLSNGSLNAPLLVRGSAVDKDGNHVVAGTVLFSGNEDTSQATYPSFRTSAGVFDGGRLLRNQDIFIRKYPVAGGDFTYSTLVGGSDNDVAGGWDLDRVTIPTDDPRAIGIENLYNFSGGTGSYRTEVITGSCVTTDSNGDIYVTGISGSFNYPRTRGVYGEVFDQFAKLVVTKISRDFTQIIFSTHLRTANRAFPGGIGVGPGGDVYITGNIQPWEVVFATPQAAGTDPTTVVFQGIGGSSVPVTGDALRAAYNSLEFPSQDGFLLKLNNTGTSLDYGSYIGGDLDDRVFAPYVDKFGDCWVAGYTCNRRVQYIGPASGPTRHDLSTSMANQISSLAYKSNIDISLHSNEPIAYGMLNRTTGAVLPYTWPPSGWIPFYESRDGFIQRYRFTLPVLTAINYNKPTLAGGLGNVATGTVVVGIAAPAPGVNVTLTMATNQAASFSSGGSVYQTTVTIPTGSTSVTFPVYTNPVSSNTNVDITANLEGNVLTGRLVVAPWLSSIAVSPNNQVGGNSVQGRVRIFEAAPAGGVTVNLSTGDTTLATVQNPTVQVLQGQTEAAFQINTFGVSTSKTVSINGSFSGVGVSQLLTLTPADVFTLTFDPARLSAGSTTTGTVKLGGNPDPKVPIKVTIDVSALGSGFVASPATLTFDASDTTQDPTTRTFKLITPFSPVTVLGNVTATNTSSGASVVGAVQIDPLKVTAISVNAPTSVNGGSPSSVSVTLDSAAGKGGAVVHVVATSTKSPIPARVQGSNGTYGTDVTVIVPEGQTSQSFPVQTDALASTATVTFAADRGTGTGFPAPVTTATPLTVLGVGFSLSLDQTSVSGGGVANGTITLTGAAPSGGLVIYLTSTDVNGVTSTAATVPTTITIPAGATTGTFQVQTNAVSVTTNALIGASLTSGGTPLTQNLEIRARSLVSIAFTPNRVRGGRQDTNCRVTIDTPAGPNGVTVLLSSSNTDIANVPASVVIKPGQTYASFTVVTNMVSRELATTVTATLSDNQTQQVSANLTVRK